MFRRSPRAAKQAATAEEQRAPRPGFRFDGLAPWTPGTGLTGCRVGDWRLDLRDDATFIGYDFGEYGMLTLRWHHDSTEDGPPEPQRVFLEFDYLRGFRAEQAEEGRRIAGETEGWDYQPTASGRADFRVYAGDSDLSFSAGGVRLRLEPV